MSVRLELRGGGGAHLLSDPGRQSPPKNSSSSSPPPVPTEKGGILRRSFLFSLFFSLCYEPFWRHLTYHPRMAPFRTGWGLTRANAGLRLGAVFYRAKSQVFSWHAFDSPSRSCMPACFSLLESVPCASVVWRKDAKPQDDCCPRPSSGVHTHQQAISISKSVLPFGRK